MPYIPEDRATELLTSQAKDLDANDLAWLLATNVEAFLTKEEPLTFERIGGALAAIETLKQELLARVLRPYIDGRRGLGVDPLAESAEAAIETLQDAMRERVLRELGIDPPGEDEEPEEPLRFPPADDEPPAAPPFPDARWVNEDEPFPADDRPPSPPLTNDDGTPGSDPLG